MTRRRFAGGMALALGAVCAMAARPASAQVFGNNNSPSTGPGSSAFAAGGASPFGGATSSPFGNSGTFASQSGQGLNAANASAFNANNPIGGTGPAGNLGLGQGGSFLGGGQNANNGALVGVNQNNRGQGGNQFGRNQFNQAQNFQNRGNRNAGRGAARQQQNQFGQFQQGQGGPQQQTTRQFRPQLRIGFQFQAASTDVASEVLSTGFAGVFPNRPEFQGISVTADGTSVILRGTVDSPQTRKLAARLAGLEPGVRKVINEIEVVPTPPAPLE